MRKQSYIIERIDDADHNPIYRAAHIAAPGMDPGATWMTSELMEQVMTRRNSGGGAQFVRLQVTRRWKNRHD